MQVSSIIKIKNDPNLYNFLRDNSRWYKELNRNPNNIVLLEEKMKENYKLTTPDKIEKISNNIQMVQMFMNMLK
ncbi:MAG: YlbE-like family protein [Bacilli bacterium]